jgi:hypothetical protein
MTYRMELVLKIISLIAFEEVKEPLG